jgi:S-adenosylmethionine/arginine decarboxylase-like enzyme
MVMKKNLSTDDLASNAGVCLAGEPAQTTASANTSTILVKINKIPLESRNKNLKLDARQNALQANSLANLPSESIKARRKQKEMKETVFGYELIMDLSDCDLGVMSSKTKLTEYVDKLCKLIDMKKYGKVLLPYFGLEKPHTKGYSMLQFIETSSITGHFSEYWRKSYINIFSCKPYDHKLAAQFTKEFFKAKHTKTHLIVR